MIPDGYLKGRRVGALTPAEIAELEAGIQVAKALEIKLNELHLERKKHNYEASAYWIKVGKDRGLDGVSLVVEDGVLYELVPDSRDNLPVN